jgi:hypothetical protein
VKVSGPTDSDVAPDMTVNLHAFGAQDDKKRAGTTGSVGKNNLRSGGEGR